MKSTSNTSDESFLLRDLKDVRFLLELIEKEGNDLEDMLRNLFFFL